MPPKGHRRCRSSELDGSEMSQVKSVYSTICTQLEALSKRIATTDAEAVYITVRSLLEDIEDVEKARASVPKGKSLDVVVCSLLFPRVILCRSDVHPYSPFRSLKSPLLTTTDSASRPIRTYGLIN